jgi:hypothetical protein
MWGSSAPPHGSDAECVAALQATMGELKAFVESLAVQGAGSWAVLSTPATTLQFPGLKRSA